MSVEYYPTVFEIKAVSLDARTIEGWAAVAGNVDKVNDVIDPAAFTKTLTEKDPSSVGVFIGHDMSRLPMGVPVQLWADQKGLFTKTLIKPTAEGDELLGTARFLRDHGQALGMSIGYRTRDSVMERREGKAVRRLLDIDLIEYSFAPSQAIANPEALVTAIKTAKALSEGTDVAGGFVVKPKEKKDPLDAAARNNLDDGDFAWVDSQGGRHLPIHDAAHVRNAIARFNQTNFDSASAKAKAWRKILAAARKFNIDVSDTSQPGKVGDPVEETKATAHMKAVKGLITAHKAAYSAHQDAMEVHGDAIDQLKSYHAALRSGDFGNDGQDPVPSEKLLEWIAQLDVKAGARMSGAHLGQLHDALDNLRSLHDSQCKDMDCVHRMDGDGQDGQDGMDGDGDGDGHGTDEGPGSSKTADVGSPEWFRQWTAELARA